MKKKIDEYFDIISNISLENLDYRYIYNELICYTNRDLNGNKKSLINVFDEIDSNKKNFVKLEEDNLLISNIDKLDDDKKKIELGIFNKIECVSENINKLIEYLNKKRINFIGRLESCENIFYLSLLINDCDDALKIIDYVNCKLNKSVYSVNPLFFSSGNVMISLYEEYSYVYILSMYLYRFILKMRELKKYINYDNFKDFMLDNYSKIDSEIEMYKYLEFNVRDIELSKFYTNIDEITNMIMYLFNGNDYDDFKDYFRKLNRKNYKNINKYKIYDDMNDSMKLLEELVDTMYLNYGEEYTKNNIVNYMNTGCGDYITRKNNLRKKVMSSKVFMIFLRRISLDDEINKIIELSVFNKNKKLLENICKETFLVYYDDENRNYGKIQVARSLIRIQCGDYSAITRNNDARKIALENINPSDVVQLIKSSLCIDEVRREEELYELYADYIEKLCIS